MAKQIQVKRPDGEVVTVSSKHFERSLQAQGFTEVKADDEKKSESKRKTEKSDA